MLASSKGSREALKRLRQIESEMFDCRDAIDNVCRLDILLEAYSERIDKEIGHLRGRLYRVYDKLAAFMDGQKQENKQLNVWEQIEQRARFYRDLLRATPAVAMTLHDANEETEFMYLDLHAPVPQRLNKQREELVGKSVLTLPPEIGQPRYYYLKKAIANGQPEEYDYFHEWEGRRWHFHVKVVPFPGAEEIATIVTDARKWQPGWWDKWLAGKQGETFRKLETPRKKARS